MKGLLLSLFMLLFFFAGCAVQEHMRLPELSGTTVDGQQQTTCTALFPRGNWQFVHSIEFTMKDGSGPPLIGVTTINGDTLGCALITVEGLTLFEALYPDNAQVVVRRAIAPFDKPEFAAGLIGDIRAIFQPPTANSVMTGQAAEATAVCRYTQAGGGVVDLELNTGDCWRIKQYSPDLLLQRSIIGRSCKKMGSASFPEYLELKTYGRNGYTLKMTLLHADTLP